VDDFLDLRAELDGSKTQVQVKLNDLENARVALEQARQSAGDRVAEFNRRIRADFPANALFNRLPTVPARAGGREAFISAMDDAADLWSRVNALPPGPLFTAPMLLGGGWTRAQFATQRTALDAAFTGRAAALAALDVQRLTRNALQDRAQILMKLYRVKIEALHAADSMKVQSLPRLTPLPGHTPDPVALTAAWNSTVPGADLTWTASTDTELQRYEVRSCPGPDYLAEDESVIATVLPGEPLAHTATAGFDLPGAAVSYKIFVRLNTGNEAGSDAETVVRPV